ncbi:hypothetical protein [Jiangella mangrovi]|uniref:Uncharacterized protein n=1 Tax=Jiangella mangrovi TaxID=1524084 RepID=A0A7W9GMU4_9ACTN|nr:hypothetical protein [Jiangella mangrovi]MBB5786770.1 hypothetical protein [Jiangella mangrovi]
MSDPDDEFETALRTALLDRAAQAPSGDDLADTVTRLGVARRRRRRIAGAGAVLVGGVMAGLAAAGSVPFAGGPDTPAPAETPEAPEISIAIDGPITCEPAGWPAFDPALLTERPPLPPHSRLGRAMIGAPPENGTITGQTLVTEDGSTAYVLVWMGDGAIAARYEYLTEGYGGWYLESSSTCEPELAFDDGLQPAEWALAGQEPGPDSTAIEIRVSSAVGCAGDLSVEGRLADVVVDERDDAVLIAPRLHPLPPGSFACQRTEPASLTVELTEPLGDRQILDGRWYPARPPSVEP